MSRDRAFLWNFASVIGKPSEFEDEDDAECKSEGEDDEVAPDVAPFCQEGLKLEKADLLCVVSVLGLLKPSFPDL